MIAPIPGSSPHSAEGALRLPLRPVLRWPVHALIALSVGACLSSLGLANFEACFYGCATLAGYEFQFGQPWGHAIVTAAVMAAQISYCIGAAMLLRGYRWWWVLIALIPYAAWYGYLGSVVLVVGRDIFEPFAGWWLWMAAGPLLVAAVLLSGRLGAGPDGDRRRTASP